MRLLRGFHDEATVEGGADAQQQARDELRREQRQRIAMQSGMPELRRSDLEPAHLSLIEHVPTGVFYAVSRAEQTGEENDSFEAFTFAPDGTVIFLDRPQSGPQTRQELEARRRL